jgi:peptidoglycan hydrolase CwlO-like protein
VAVLTAGSAAAAPATLPRTAAVAESTEVPAKVAVSGSFPASLVAKEVIYNNQVDGLQQRKTKLTTEKSSLTRSAARFNAATDAYNKRDAACGTRIQTHNQKLAAYNADVDEYNATDHDFLLPDEQGAYDAAVARKEQLDTEGTALSEEKASIDGEQQQLDVEEAQLSAQKAQLATDMANHNAAGDTWTADQQRLAATHQELLGEMVTALEELLTAPPAQAAAMAGGGDAPEPASPAQAAQAPGGDPASRAGQVTSLASYAVRNHLPVRFQPSVVRLSPGAASKVSASKAAQLPLSVTYDGLAPEADGNYLALLVQSGDAGTDQGASAFGDVLTRGGRATATVDGSPVVVDRAITVPDDDRVDDPCNTGALFIGSIVYLPRHKQAGECVASGAYGQLGPQNYTGDDRPSLGFALPGLTTLPWNNRSRGHLIGYAMGGENKDTRNFVPLYQKANQWMYNNAEEAVVKSIKAGGHVYVEAYPVYGNPDSPVPTSVKYYTDGDVKKECVIQNNATGAGSHCENGS